MIKSLNNPRAYKYLVLNNGLKCLIVSDPENQKAGCALSVSAGGYDAPKDLPGLAHLLEHMLFYGSTTYPGENYYLKYIMTHGGHCNASTFHEKTEYYFDVLVEYFDHALDIFSQLFIDPIFNESMIQKEIIIVDSEFYDDYDDCSKKSIHVLNELIDPECQITGFLYGNKKTLLVPDIYQRLIDFYSNNYSSDRMCLVIQSNESITSLEKMIIDKFSRIPRRTKTLAVTNEKLLTDDNFLKISRGIPYVKMETHALYLSIEWQLPVNLGIKPEVKSKITDFWCNIISDEGTGSLWSYLWEELYITELCVTKSFGKKNDKLVISLSLTMFGNTNVQLIVKIIHNYIKKLLKIHDHDIIRMYDEMKKIDQICFDNESNSKDDTCNYVIKLVNNLENFENDQVLMGQYFWPCIDDQLVNELKEYIRVLSVTRPIILHGNPIHSFDQTSLRQEKYYGTKYEVVQDDEIWNNSSKSIRIMNKIMIPGPNPYIPSDFSIFDKKSEEIEIKKINTCTFGELWYKPDTQSNQPKICLCFNLLLGDPVIKNTTLCKLYISLLNEILIKKIFCAKKLNSCRICFDNGISITLHGYSDKIMVMWTTIIDTMMDINQHMKMFNVVFNNEKRKYNFEPKKLSEQLDALIEKLYLKNKINDHDALNYLNKITHADFCTFEKQLYKCCYYIGLIQGNAKMDQCNEIKEYLHKFLYKKKSEFVRFQLPEILAEQKFDQLIQNYKSSKCEEHEIYVLSAVLYDFGDNHFSDARNRFLNQIVVQILNESFFNKLRTRQQLGYTVKCDSVGYAYLDKKNGGILFIVQSSTYCSEHLQKKINDFIDNIFESFDAKIFDHFVDSLMTTLSLPNQSLIDSFLHNLSRIMERSFIFTQKNLIKEIGVVTYDDLIKYVNDHIVNNHKKLIININ
jgi:secreted Zn-dependent insulinase-like peptidase